MAGPLPPSDERFPLVNESGDVIGSARRCQVHGNPALLHPVVHCIVVSSKGDILLQRRSLDKDVQPGKWDTSVGGHVALGESIPEALCRELREEIGLDVDVAQPQFLYRYLMRNETESELVHTFSCQADGPFQRQVEELDELRFWSWSEIDRAIGTGIFTPNLEDEASRFRRVAAGGAPPT